MNMEEITDEVNISEWKKEKTIKLYLIGEFDDGGRVRVFENIANNVRVRVRAFEKYAYLTIEVRE
jgi:hypothetical protein